MNILLKFISLSSIAASAWALQACDFHEDKNPVDVSGSNILMGHVSYDEVQKEVLSVSCNQCHGAGSSGGVNLTSFANASGSADRIRKTVFGDKSMPRQGSLNAYQLAMLKAWLDEGAPQEPGQPQGSNQPPVDTRVDASQLSYANLNDKIFQPLCSKCHGNGVGVDLTTYDNVKANIARVSTAALARGSMPPKTPLTADQANLLGAWIMAGAPQMAPETGVLPTYESIYANVFQPLCMNCHGSSKLAKKVPLAPYAAIMDSTINDTVIANHSDQSAIMEVISKDLNDKDVMPPSKSGILPLSKATVDVIRAWIDAGAPQK